MVLFRVLRNDEGRQHVLFELVHVSLRSKKKFKPCPQNGSLIPLRVFFKISDRVAMVREK